MDEPDLFNATVSSLYQTVLEPERWTEAIYNVAHLFEASTASMFDYDLVNQTPSHFRIFGHDGSVERAYSSFSYTITDQFGANATTSVEITVATVLGTPGNHAALNGDPNVDYIVALGGNDTINAAGGDDYVFAGLGNDIIIGGAGADQLEGGPILAGGLPDDDIFRVSGTDLVADIIEGGDGTNTLQFFGTGPVTWGPASMFRVQQLDMAGVAMTVTANADLTFLTRIGTPGIINGSPVANTITGTQQADIINSLGGNDVLDGAGGGDSLLGGAGSDTVNGDTGDDIITGGAEADVLNGGADNDTFRVSGGNLIGVNTLGLPSADTIDGGAGTDTLLFTGNVNLKAGYNFAGVELLDMVTFNLNVNTTQAVNLSALARAPLPNAPAVPGQIIGNNLANDITGSQGIDTINGGQGADIINGDSGDDIITGGAEADVVLNGGAGNDTFLVSGGELDGDTVDGGAGTDTLRFTANTNLTTGFTMANVEQLDMGTFALGVNTAAAVNLSSLTRLNTSATATIDGNNLANTITGTQSADTITGGAGTDVLNGAGGADRIVGGAGNDTLTGGTGNDTFVFNVASNAGNADTITDFNAAVDLIELSLLQFTQLGGTNISGATLAAGDFAFGTAASTVGALVNVIYDSATGALYYDSNGGTNANRSLIATLNPLPTDTFDFNNIRVGP